NTQDRACSESDEPGVRPGNRKNRLCAVTSSQSPDHNEDENEANGDQQPPPPMLNRGHKRRWWLFIEYVHLDPYSTRHTNVPQTGGTCFPGSIRSCDAACWLRHVDTAQQAAVLQLKLVCPSLAASAQ